MMKISVIGAGTMGAGIAQIAATNGHEVCLYDSFDGAIEKFGNRLRDKQFNTKKRLKTYLDYDYALSTKLTPLLPFTPLRLLNTSYCDQNIDVLP